MKRYSRVATHIEKLRRSRHHPDSDLAVGAELRLGGADARSPVALQVVRVLFVLASKRPRTRSAKSGTSCSISLQEGIASLLSTGGEGADQGPQSPNDDRR